MGPILNVPNTISLIRLALIPLFAWLLIGAGELVWGGWLLFIIASTDWVDGYLARRLDQVTEFGKLLDPVADRMAVVAAVGAGWWVDALPNWFVILLIAREVVVALGAAYVGLRGGGKIDVRIIGKRATFGIYSAITWFILAKGYDWEWLRMLATFTGIIALSMYYIALGYYAVDGLQQIDQGRSEPVTPDS
jgi:cardiolipin synthase